MRLGRRRPTAIQARGLMDVIARNTSAAAPTCSIGAMRHLASVRKGNTVPVSAPYCQRAKAAPAGVDVLANRWWRPSGLIQ